MILCIAEKPSVGREIAAVLGADTVKNGYMEGNGYWVSWTFGHLCTLQEPHDYTSDWKNWRMELLPMIPQRFRLKLISQKGIETQFRLLESLIQQAEEIVNCGDAGQEGELIQRWVLQKAQCKVPVKRLWISSLTEKAIRDGFEHLYPSSDFDNLYAAGSARAIGDWLLGINATRAYTLKYAEPGKVISVGRVQTPTLALLVERQKAIENFKPQKYWELKTMYRDGLFSAVKGKFPSEEEATKVLDKIRHRPLEILKVERKNSKEHPPKLFDLTLLQVECNKKFGFSAEKTLGIIQSLYEKKLTTYPRVDTNFLPNDIYGQSEKILQGLTPYATFVQELLANPPLRKSKKVFNDKKITDHHAIIPTGEFAAASSLSKDEKYVFDLVIRRFLAVFYPDSEFANTQVAARVLTEENEEVAFRASGKELLFSGWRVVLEEKGGETEPEDNSEENRILPTYQEGESGPHTPGYKEKQTQPPKYMTEGDLLRAMETAGKQVENEDLRSAMKENGIGRPSTRAAIIEILYKRGYIVKEKKRIVPTALGMELIENIEVDLLKSAELTGIWEYKLKKIADGEYAVQDFMQELKQMVNDVIYKVRITPRR